jgi:hypothetical protein
MKLQHVEAEGDGKERCKCCKASARWIVAGSSTYQTLRNTGGILVPAEPRIVL